MNKVLEFLGVVFLVIAFWTMIGKYVSGGKTRDFKHWLDEDD